MGRKRAESEKVRKWRASIKARIQRLRAAMPDEAELIDKRKSLAAQIANWRKQVSELNRANLEDGARIGLTPDDEMLARRVSRKARIERLKVDAADAEEKLEVFDAQLRIIEADTAETTFRHSVSQIKLSATPAAWSALRDSGLTLIRHRRLNTSSALLLMKINRLSNVAGPQAVRVRGESVDDFLLWLPKKKEAA